MARADLASFFKLTAVVYAAFVLSLGAYVMHLERPHVLGTQLGLLTAALFAAAVSLRSASETLSNANGLTLVDAIHIVVLLYILIAFVVIVGGRLLEERGWPAARIAHLNARTAAIAVASFLAINAVLIGLAVRVS